MLKLKKIENVLLFLILLSLPTQLGKHFWPDSSYIFSLRVDYLSPTIFFWDILVVILLLVWLLQKPQVRKLALNLLLFFLLTQAVSLLGAKNIGAGLVRLEQYGLSGLFAVYLASFDFKSLSRRVFLVLFLGVLAETLIASGQFLHGSTLGLWILGERSFTISTPGIAKFDFYGFQFLRPYGTFPHPNVLAGYLLVIMVLWLQFAVYNSSKKRITDNVYKAKLEKAGKLKPLVSNLTKITMLLCGFTIFITMSRAVLLTGFLSMFLLLEKRWRTLLVLSLVVLSPILFIRFSSLFNFDSLTVLRREELIGSAWQLFLKSPLFGIGLNNFIPAMATNMIIGPSRFLQPVHNIILLALSETGIVGMIGLIFLVGYPIAKLLKLPPKPYHKYPILMIWVIILFLGMFDHYFLTLPQGYRLFFLVWGLSFSVLE